MLVSAYEPPVSTYQISDMVAYTVHPLLHFCFIIGRLFPQATGTNIAANLGCVCLRAIPRLDRPP